MTTTATTPDSPFTHLLSSNYAASETDVPLIKNLITTSSNILHRLNSEIEQLQSSLRKLEQERDAVQQYIDAHGALLSRCRSLPAEVLSEIFGHCLPVDRNAVCSQSEAPLLLGRVCKSWRDVSFSTPRLWASIHIVVPTSASSSVLCPLIDASREGVESWLSRSGSLPLSISVYAVPSSDASRRRVYIQGALLDHIKNLLECVFQRSDRWHTVQFSFTRSVISMISEQWPWGGNTQFPILRSFKLSRPDSLWRAPDAKFDREWLSKSPALRSLSLRQLDARDILAEQFPWPHLTHLELQMPNIKLPAILSVLSQCRDLQSLTVANVESRLDSPTEIRTITLPFLSNLSIRGGVYLPDITNPVNVRNIFCFLDTPMLRCLKVDIYGMAPNHCIPFVGLLAPGNQVQELDISVPLDMLLRTLALLPNLTSLHVRNSALDDAFLRRLTLSHDQEENLEPLCPSLKRLYLLGESITNSDQILLNLVNSRRNAISTFTSQLDHASGSMPSGSDTSLPAPVNLDVFHVLVDLYRSLPDSRSRLQELRDQGMDIIFAHREEGKRNPSSGQYAEDDRVSSRITKSKYSRKIRKDEVRRHSWWSWR